MVGFSRSLSALTALLTLAAASSGKAQTVVSHTSTINVLSSPPSTVMDILYPDATHFNAFYEKQNYVLPVPVATDLSAPGTYNFVSMPTQSNIASGTGVDSFFIHATSPFLTTITGSITFAQSILGVQAVYSTLPSGDAILGVPGTTYGEDGYESDGDIVTISPDLHTLYLTAAVQDGDNVRVLLAGSTPEAGTPEFAAAFCAAAVAAIRRKRRAR